MLIVPSNFGLATVQDMWYILFVMILPLVLLIMTGRNRWDISQNYEKKLFPSVLVKYFYFKTYLQQILQHVSQWATIAHLGFCAHHHQISAACFCFYDALVKCLFVFILFPTTKGYLPPCFHHYRPNSVWYLGGGDLTLVTQSLFLVPVQ